MAYRSVVQLVECLVWGQVVAGSNPATPMKGGLAQLVEHVTENHGVPGSIPGATIW